MPTTSFFHSHGLTIAACLILVAGCQSGSTKPTGDLAGKVTYQGKAVTDAKIQIQSPETGYAEGAKVDADGNYQYSAPIVAGRYVVSVEPIFQLPVAGSTPAPVKPPARADIPAKYRDGGTSGLTVTVVKGKTTKFDVDMTDAK